MYLYLYLYLYLHICRSLLVREASLCTLVASNAFLLFDTA